MLVSHIYCSIYDCCDSIWIQIYMFCIAGHNHYIYMPSIYLRNVKIATANWHLTSRAFSLFFLWLTRENIDLNRVPQVIHEASCHTRHSCNGLDNTFGLETIPLTLRMPVLKKNPNCFPTSSYSLEFELITVACICAFSRNSWSGIPS